METELIVLIIVAALLFCGLIACTVWRARRSPRGAYNLIRAPTPKHYHDLDKKRVVYPVSLAQLKSVGVIQLTWRCAEQKDATVQFTYAQVKTMANFPVEEELKDDLEKQPVIWIASKTPIFIHQACDFTDPATGKCTLNPPTATSKKFENQTKFLPSKPEAWEVVPIAEDVYASHEWLYIKPAAAPAPLPAPSKRAPPLEQPKAAS